MKALFYPAFGQLIIDEQPVPGIHENEVLIKVAACGICGSELETFHHHSERRLPPLIMGHEFAGTIVQTGSAVKGFKAGDRVVSNSIVPCGHCVRCRQGDTNLCVRREVFGMQRNGAFAEFVNVPAHCLVPVPEGLSPEKACLAEPLANGVHMVRLTRNIMPARVLIIGAGPVGLLAMQAFQAIKGSETMAADIKNERLAVAKRLGAKFVINPRTDNLVDTIMTVTEGEGADIVIDAVGIKETGAEALKAVRPGGALLLIGLHENNSSLWSYDIILPEKQVLGTYAAKPEDIAEALRLIAAGKVDVSSWVHYYPMDKGVTAFEEMLSGEGDHIKSVVLPGTPAKTQL